MPEFNAYRIDLGGGKMIEASAGTGKTFSLALLVIRLVVEKNIPVGKILLMTFTNAAVAELEERVRLFIRLGYEYISGYGPGTPALVKLLAEDKNESEIEQAKDRLNRAMLELDQLSVLTIHSFCSKMLTRFSFETGQAIDSQPLDNIGKILSPLVDDFWRRNVATLDKDLLKRLLKERKLKRSDIANVVDQALGGKEYAFMDYDASMSFVNSDAPSLAKKIEREFGKCRADFSSIKRVDTRGKYIELMDSGKFEEVADKLLDAIKKEQKYLGEIPDMRMLAEECEDSLVRRYQGLISIAIKEIVPKFHESILSRNLITYNDMIERMRMALEGEGKDQLVRVLRDEYKAVFIDEFQDTDRSQFEIFRITYMTYHEGDQPIVFLIGDPKQMIYAWRKADMETYLSARESVGENNVYEMKENFRSSKRMIDSMNVYFQEIEGFDVFLLNGNVRYINVAYPEQPKTSGELLDVSAKTPDLPIEIHVSQNKSELKKRLMGQLSGLVGTQAKARMPDPLEPEGYRKVRYSDIGILVRKNSEAREIKRLLSNFGIPSIQIDETSIFDTDEAELILYLLVAFLDRSPNNIKRAIFSPLTGLKHGDVGKIDLDLVTETFRKCHDAFLTKGVFSAVMTFMEAHKSRYYLIFESGVNGERVYANLNHLLELLHEAETEYRMSPDELIVWLRKQISSSEDTEKEYEQRLESDEDAVKIVTIHKSKGLEYNIVFAPFLNLKMRGDIVFRSFRMGGRYMTGDKYSMTEDHKKLSSEEFAQENRRLMYVAVTRAKYKCYLHQSEKDTGEGVSVIGQFIQKLIGQSKGGEARIWIRDPENPGILAGQDTCIGIYKYSEKERTTLRHPSKSFFFRTEDFPVVPRSRRFEGPPVVDNWRRLSYSSIKASSSEKGASQESKEHEDEFENFIFNEYPKGAKAGSILHSILERIDFTETDSRNWKPVISEVLAFYRLKGDRERQIMKILEWIGHLLSVELTVGGETFKLSQVGLSDLISEFEFDFRLDEFPVGSLAEAAGDIPVKINQDLGTLHGIMNGKMDLFFRHNAKYYILDWKSNHLGSTLADYDDEHVRAAMEVSNFNLQYLIYSIAARKYLTTRIPAFEYEGDFGGVIYLFMRGVRRGAETGLFVDKVGVETLNRFESVMNGSLL
jgi:exodeoxyribonuclease V beta subunit